MSAVNWPASPKNAGPTTLSESDWPNGPGLERRVDGRRRARGEVVEDRDGRAEDDGRLLEGHLATRS